MFSCKQDIGLLHGSLLSVASSKSGSIFLCKDIQDAVNVVSKSVKNIVYYKLDGIKEGKEAVKQEIHTNRRLHAAVLFTALRSHGIISSSADTFYNSIVYSWPAVDFKFYVELAFKSDWSEYFIMSAAQLPPEVLCKVLNIILDISFSSHVKYFSWHLIIQTLILKLLEVPYASEKGCPFDFDFPLERTEKSQTDENIETYKIDEDSLHNKPDVTMLKEMFVNLILHISVELNGSSKEDMLKILLHAVKTLLKCLISENQRDFKNVSQFVDFLKIYELLQNFLLTDSNKGLVRAALQNCSCEVVCHAFATTSWNICLNYLTILLDYYSGVVSSESYSPIKEHSELVFKEMIDTSLYSIIKNLDFPFLCVPSTNLDQRLKMLRKIIQLDFAGSSVAVKIILQSDPSLIEAKDTIVVLEENSHVIDFEHQYQLIIESIMAAKPGDSKYKLLEVLYKLLRVNDIKNYDRVLNYILCQYGLGYATEFQLPDFGETFCQFTRKTPTLEEAEKILPALFVQCPIDVLVHLIDQALVQGSAGKVFIQLLQHFQKSCLYSTNLNMPILPRILNRYFENKTRLEAYEIKNMVTLYKFLVEIPYETPMFLSSFLKYVFIPKLNPFCHKLYLILECVNVLLPALLKNGMEPATMSSLIYSLGKIIDYSLKTGNGQLKSLVTPILKKLEIHERGTQQFTDKEKKDLWSLRIQKLDETVCVYVKEFLPGLYIDFSSKSFIWTWCCKTENTYFFEENFSCETLTYLVLLDTLLDVLPHLTKEEWLYSFNLMKICCKKHVLRDEILHSFNNPFQLSEAELEKYAVISCIITSLHFIFNDRDCDFLYVSSCFSNGLINLLNQEEETVKTRMLITIFLDMCYLIECVSSDIIQIFTTTLLELKKHIINSCFVENSVKDCKLLITSAVMCLPNSPTKLNLFQKLCV